MPRALTDAEAKAVESKKRSPRPRWFNDATKKEEPISVHGEAWAALNPEKSKVISVLQEMMDDTYERTERTTLFTQVTDSLVDALKKRAEEYLKDVQTIEDAEKTLGPQQNTTQGTKMEGVNDTFEVQLIAEDIRVSKDEIRRKYEEVAFEREWIEHTMTTRWAMEGAVDAHRRKRMTSWVTMLGAY